MSDRIQCMSGFLHFWLNRLPRISAANVSRRMVAIQGVDSDNGPRPPDRTSLAYLDPHILNRGSPLRRASGARNEVNFPYSQQYFHGTARRRSLLLGDNLLGAIIYLCLVAKYYYIVY
jgi:hypothetical protein